MTSVRRMYTAGEAAEILSQWLEDEADGSETEIESSSDDSESADGIVPADDNHIDVVFCDNESNNIVVEDDVEEDDGPEQDVEDPPFLA